ncbi:putative enkurin [Cardiosporidium cionae]|uniref:Enkurin n=1 Tax=Cardiosporidium cionae TaxID=476202 RepID=A0ABQ7J9Q5_9APIC|nr:putative enkurin [Cardiosporidium cionae]|eukprot:KAF8820730.1 putative enkurin [Cardiosporidium cionae]
MLLKFKICIEEAFTVFQMKESIFDLLLNSQEEFASIAGMKKNYRSKHNPAMLPTASSFLIKNTNKPFLVNLTGKMIKEKSTKYPLFQENATFGPNSIDRNISEPRKKYIPKSKRVPYLSIVKKLQPELLCVKQIKSTQKPPLNQVNKGVIFQGLHATKNFIHLNLKQAKATNTKFTKAPTSAKIARDMTIAAKHRYFGEIPKYLARIAPLIDKEDALLRDACWQKNKDHEKQSVIPRLERMNKDEQERLISGLRYQWECLNKEFQNLSRTQRVETLRKGRMKETLEERLIEVEKYLEILQKSCILTI